MICEGGVFVDIFIWSLCYFFWIWCTVEYEQCGDGGTIIIDQKGL